MEIIALLGKGGTAKTTSTATLGHAFARRGLRTVIVDLDSQASLSDWLAKDRDEQPAIEDVLMGRSAWSEVLVDITDNLRIAPTMNFRLSEVETHIESMKRQRELLLASSLDALSKTGECDVVIVDTPRGLDTNIAVNVVEAMTWALVVSEPAPMSLAAHQEIVLAVREVEADRHRQLLLGVLPTRYFNTNVAKMTLDVMRDDGDLRLFTPVRNTTLAAEPVADHCLLWDWDPDSTAVRDYEAVADEIVKVLDERKAA